MSSVVMVGQNAKPVVNSAFAFEVSVASVNETLASTQATTTANTK
jgi:hypothetical protein